MENKHEEYAKISMKHEMDMFIKRSKTELRKLALESAIKVGATNVIKEAEDIYQWIIKDLE